ncbi:Protein OS-9 [Podochytrium sp. JEL0797]|nr:Protein OS-9 [Podochytrium sp. JEL0797]
MTHISEPIDELSANQRAVKLMHGLHRNCLNFTASWWIYSYCHGGKIVQYSNFPEKYNLPKLEYLLGVYKEIPSEDAFYGDRAVSAAGGAQLIDNDAEGSKYLRMWYGEGDMCETGLKRVVEVQFSCCEHDHIVSVTETTVCQYIVTIHTNRACHKLFQPVHSNLPATAITCSRILDDHHGESEPFEPVSLSSLLHNGCNDPLTCPTPPVLSIESPDYTSTQHNAETRSDMLKGSVGAGIHPSQTNIDQDAFDTLWLDVYDPIPVEGEEMDEVVEAANLVLFGGDWTGDDVAGGGETYGGAEVVEVEEEVEDVDVVEMIKEELANTRIALWRKLVERKREEDVSQVEDEDGMALPGEEERLTVDLWEAALERVPEEAVDALDR